MKITSLVVTVDSINERVSKNGVPYSYANCHVNDSRFLAFVNMEVRPVSFPCSCECELHTGKRGLTLRVVKLIDM